MPFAATWMELETLILSEGSQKEKDKYWSSHRGTVEVNPTRNHEVVGWIPSLTQ